MISGNPSFHSKQVSDQALRLHQEGNLTEAERLYRQILATEPDNFTARHSLGIIRAQQGRNAEATELIGAALKINPGAARAWVNHGNLLSAAARFGEALESYDKALAIRPDDFDALLNRARVLLDLKRHEDALRDYDKVLAARPDDVEALNNRGNILRSLKHFEDALASYDRALAVEPRLADTLINRGVTLSELLRPHDALASYNQALAIKPMSAAAFNNRGFTLRDLGRLYDALADYNKALALEPDYPAALNNRAKVLCELDRVAEGFVDFTRSAQLTQGVFVQEAPDGAASHKITHDQEQRAYLAETELEIAEKLHLEGGLRLGGQAINLANDAGAITAQWQTATPNSVVIDDFLTDEALVELRRFCWGSTLWRTVYSDGYLGTFPEQGFACPLLAQIAMELRDAFPAIFRGQPLLYLWAFKYDSALAGTAVHADEAMVNVNFWITPDDANLDPKSGGLVIWDTKPPADWDFARYNGEPGPIRAFLTRSGAKSITVPYRANRAIIFDSDLFHETDTVRFKDGYLNRRINVTLLYGRRNAGEF